MITYLEMSMLGKNTFEMCELTKNTVVIFDTPELKYQFVQEFMKIFNGEDGVDDGVTYCTVEDNELAAEQDHMPIYKKLIEYLPTTIIEVDEEQRFVFTVEAPFVLTCTDRNDLWFCDEYKGCEIEMNAFTHFKGNEETWDKGIMEVYRQVIHGRFGGYDGYGK